MGEIQESSELLAIAEVPFFEARHGNYLHIKIQLGNLTTARIVRDAGPFATSLPAACSSAIALRQLGDTVTLFAADDGSIICYVGGYKSSAGSPTPPRILHLAAADLRTLGEVPVALTGNRRNVAIHWLGAEAAAGETQIPALRTRLVIGDVDHVQRSHAHLVVINISPTLQVEQRLALRLMEIGTDSIRRRHTPRFLGIGRGGPRQLLFAYGNAEVPNSESSILGVELPLLGDDSARGEDGMYNVPGEIVAPREVSPLPSDVLSPHSRDAFLFGSVEFARDACIFQSPSLLHTVPPPAIQAPVVRFRSGVHAGHPVGAEFTLPVECGRALPSLAVSPWSTDADAKPHGVVVAITDVRLGVGDDDSGVLPGLAVLRWTAETHWEFAHASPGLKYMTAPHSPLRWGEATVLVYRGVWRAGLHARLPRVFRDQVRALLALRLRATLAEELDHQRSPPTDDCAQSTATLTERADAWRLWARLPNELFEHVIIACFDAYQRAHGVPSRGDLWHAAEADGPVFTLRASDIGAGSQRQASEAP